MSKPRPSVDQRSYDFADEMLNTSDKFTALRPDIQEDLTWELADQVQRVLEDYLKEQKLDD
jgi:hypothetical protein